MFWHSFKPTKNKKIFTRMIHYKLNKYGASCMYIQFPMDMLVLSTVSSEPNALVFVWLVIRKLLSCSKMLHHDGRLQYVDAPVGQRWRLAQPLILHLKMFCFFLNISTWHQFCTCQDVMVLLMVSTVLHVSSCFNLASILCINTSIHQSINTEIV